MGELFIKKHTEQFQHHQDAAFQQELIRRNLFSDRPEIYSTDYPCRPLAPGQFPVGTLVVAQPHPDGSVEIVCANQLIGTMGGAAAKQLQSILHSDPRAGGMMKARIESRSQLSGGFTIRCAEEGSPYGQHDGPTGTE